MGANLKVTLPLQELLCHACVAPPQAPESAYASDVHYSLTMIDVLDKPGDQPLRVELDVKSIEIRKLQYGRYEAHAVVDVQCPSCHSPHELSRKMRAPLILLEQITTCERCGDALTVDKEVLRFDDGEGDTARISVQATLSCGHCNHQSIVGGSVTIDKGSLDDDRAIYVGFDAVRDRVFISYSRMDSEWLEKVKKGLKPFLRQHGISTWSSDGIEPGRRWEEEIRVELGRAKVAVLLVSQNFLASDFITDVEVPLIVSAAERGALTIIWVPLTWTPHEQTIFAHYQAAYDPRQPLESLSESDRNRALVAIARAICEAATR